MSRLRPLIALCACVAALSAHAEGVAPQGVATGAMVEVATHADRDLAALAASGVDGERGLVGPGVVRGPALDAVSSVARDVADMVRMLEGVEAAAVVSPVAGVDVAWASVVLGSVAIPGHGAPSPGSGWATPTPTGGTLAGPGFREVGILLPDDLAFDWRARSYGDAFAARPASAPWRRPVDRVRR